MSCTTTNLAQTLAATAVAFAVGSTSRAQTVVIPLSQPLDPQMMETIRLRCQFDEGDWIGTLAVSGETALAMTYAEPSEQVRYELHLCDPERVLCLMSQDELRHDPSVFDGELPTPHAAWLSPDTDVAGVLWYDGEIRERTRTMDLLRVDRLVRGKGDCNWSLLQGPFLLANREERRRARMLGMSGLPQALVVVADVHEQPRNRREFDLIMRVRVFDASLSCVLDYCGLLTKDITIIRSITIDLDNGLLAAVE